MEFVATQDIREGMCVCQNIYDDNGRLLVARGQLVGRHHIARLRRFGINSLFIDPENGEAKANKSRPELREECAEVLRDTCKQISKDFAAKQISVNAAAIDAAVNHLLDALSQCKNGLVTLLDVATGPDRMMQHSVNVTVLSTLIGHNLRLTETMLKDLAVGTLFHDIGLIFLPEALVSKPSPLTPEEMVLYRRHTELGFQHLLKVYGISNIAASVAFRHHEMLNGNGYPEGLSADKLSILTRIASVVEVYDTLTSPRFGMPASLPDAALSYILGHTNTMFDRDVVLALCKRIVLYPVGSAIQLNTGEFGVIVGILPNAPFRPVVRVVADRKGKMMSSPSIVDMTTERAYSIKRSAPQLELLLKEKGVEPPLPVPPDPTYAHIG